MIEVDVVRNGDARDFGAEVMEAAARALEDGAAEIVKEARVRAGGGSLASTISADRGTDPLIWEVRATAPYARFVEFGTRRMAGRPFLGPASRLVWPRVVGFLKTILSGGRS